MNCSEFQDRLMDVPAKGAGFPACQLSPAPGEPVFPQDSAATAHLAECSECREIWEEMLLLGDALRALQAVVPQVDLKNRVLAEWRHAPIQISDPVPVSFVEERFRRNQLVQSRWLWRPAAVAALLLAGVGIGVALMWNSQPNSNQSLAVKSQSTDSGAASGTPGILPSGNPARTAVAGTTNPLIAVALIRETATALTGAADALIPINRAIVSAPPRRPRDQSGSKGSEIVKRDDEAVPLSQQLRETLDDLWLPAETADFPSS